MVRLVSEAREIAARERFLHWQTAFPGVWRSWRDARTGGFDAVIGNPPWDKIELDDVSWFRSQHPEYRDREKVKKSELRRTIDIEKESQTKLWRSFEEARAVTAQRVKIARKTEAYAAVAAGRADIYGLFVARTLDIIRSDGAIGLIVPTGIVADKRLAPFFSHLCDSLKIRAVYDFENRQGPAHKKGKAAPFFAEVDNRFRFSAFFAGGPRRTEVNPRFSFMKSAASIPVLDEQSLVLSRLLDLQSKYKDGSILPITERRNHLKADVRWLSTTA